METKLVLVMVMAVLRRLGWDSCTFPLA